MKYGEFKNIYIDGLEYQDRVGIFGLLWGHGDDEVSDRLLEEMDKHPGRCQSCGGVSISMEAKNGVVDLGEPRPFCLNCETSNVKLKTLSRLGMYLLDAFGYPEFTINPGATELKAFDLSIARDSAGKYFRVFGADKDSTLAKMKGKVDEPERFAARLYPYLKEYVDKKKAQIAKAERAEREKKWLKAQHSKFFGLDFRYEWSSALQDKDNDITIDTRGPYVDEIKVCGKFSKGRAMRIYQFIKEELKYEDTHLRK